MTARESKCEFHAPKIRPCPDTPPSAYAGLFRRQETQICKADNQNVAAGPRLDSELRFVSHIDSHVVFRVDELDLGTEAKRAIQVSADRRIDRPPGVGRQLLIRESGSAHIDSAVEKTPAKTVFERGHGSGLQVASLLSLIDFPGREHRRIPQLGFVEVVSHAGLDLFFPETKARIER